MKITEVRTVPVWGPRRRAFGGITRTALGPAAVSDYTIVFLDTDAGLTGIGHVVEHDHNGDALRGHVDPMAAPAAERAAMSGDMEVEDHRGGAADPSLVVSDVLPAP